MLCPTPILVTVMIFAAVSFTILGVSLFMPHPSRADTLCQDGRACPDKWACCERGCCVSTAAPPRRYLDAVRDVQFQYQWYAQWPFLFLAGTVVGVALCCVWCLCYRSSARQCSCIFACCFRRPHSERDSAGSCYPPPHYSRCGSFHQAPPPYSEVTSKPDLYPLVITCGEGDNKGGGNYLMVHYFKNYVIRPPGSLSATSTAESLNSSFICNAANEANTVVPPPYSCASNYEEWRGVGCGSLLRSLSSLTEPHSPRAAPPRSRTAHPVQPAMRSAADLSPEDSFRGTLITSPIQPLDSSYDLDLELIDYDLCCDSGCRPKLGTSPPPQRSPSTLDESVIFERDFDRLRHIYNSPCPSPLAMACESPPQPTSPTQSRESTLRRTSDERRHKRHDSMKRMKARKTSLYMPLTSPHTVRQSRISPGLRTSSRSLPATPCGSLVPNLLAFSQRVSATRHGSRSSKLEEENDPLLTDNESSRTDHKF